MTANCSLLLIYLPLKDERYKQDTCTQCTYDMTLFHHTSLQHDSKLTYNVSSVTLNDCHIQHIQQDTCTQCTYDMTLFHHTSLQHDPKLTYNCVECDIKRLSHSTYSTVTGAIQTTSVLL